MSEITITLAGKEYPAKLSINAVERIESQFDNMGLPGLLAGKGGGLRTAKAILTACLTDQDETLKLKDCGEILDKEAEANGIDSLWESIKKLVEASGLYGKKKAKEASLGN